MNQINFGVRLMLILAFSVFFRLNAQELKVFSEDPTAFIGELGTYMQSSTDREVKQALSGFDEGWNTGRYEASVQQEIIKTCNLMLIQRMRPTPGFRDYLLSLNSFPEATTAKSYLAWHKGLAPLIDGNNCGS